MHLGKVHHIAIVGSTTKNQTIESFGTGFGRVSSLYDREGIKTSFGNNDFGFVFEFIRTPNVSINVPINDMLNLSDSEILVFNIIKSHNKVNKAQIAKMIGKSEMTVQRAINKLINNNLIERIGSNKTGYWKEK